LLNANCVCVCVAPTLLMWFLEEFFILVCGFRGFIP
jgi:hypothetical protein